MDTLPSQQDQYKMLREEIVQHMREINQTELSGAIAVGAVYTWLLVHKQNITSPAVWFIGPCVVLLCSIRCWVLTAQMWRIAKYLRRIEEVAFQNPTIPGWERYIVEQSKRRLYHVPTIVSVCVWILGIVFTIAASWVLSK